LFSSYKERIFLKFIFLVKCVIVSLKILDHSCFWTLHYFNWNFFTHNDRQFGNLYWKWKL